MSFLLMLLACTVPCPDGSTLTIRGNEGGRARFCARADGTRHGSWQAQRLDGTVSLEGAYADGEPDGLWVRYHPDGQRLSEETYVDGRSSGPLRRWSPGGQLLTDGQTFEGKAVGTWTFYRADGSKQRRVRFDEGRETDVHTRWSAAGDVVSECKQGEAPGRVSCVFHSDGGTERGERVGGKRQGEWITTAADGTTLAELHFKDGVPVGSARRWHPGGQLAEEGSYDNEGRALKLGWWKRWAADGSELPDVAFGTWSPGSAVAGAVPHPDPRMLWQFADRGRQAVAGPGRLGDTAVFASETRVVGLDMNGVGAQFHGLVPVSVRPAPAARLSESVAWPTASGHVLEVREEGWELHAAELADNASLYGVGDTLVIVEPTQLRGLSQSSAWTRAASGPVTVLGATDEALFLQEGERRLRLLPSTGSVGKVSTAPEAPVAQLRRGALYRGDTLLDPGPWTGLDATSDPWLLSGPPGWLVAFDPEAPSVSLSSARPPGLISVSLERGDTPIAGKPAFRTYTWTDDDVDYERVAFDTRGYALDDEELWVKAEVTEAAFASFDWHRSWPGHSAKQAQMTMSEPMMPLWERPRVVRETEAEQEGDALDGDDFLEQ